MLTPEQAQTGLAALIGGGGISAIAVSFLGFLTAARNGKKAPDPPPFFGGSQPNRWDEVSTGHLATIAFALTKLVAISEIKAEEEIDDKSFRDRLDTKVARLVIEAFKASGMKPT